MTNRLYQWLNYIQTTLIPPHCILCGQRGEDICLACRASLPRLDGQCVRCAEPMETPGLHALCGRCQVKPPAFERTWAPFRYEAPLDYLLQQLKFHGCLDIARLLGGLMSAWLQEHLDDWPDVLIPVPLHAGRLRERGFNQSLELARILAERLALPVDYQCCARLRLTPPQAGLVRKARIRNVKGAFEVNGRVYGHVAIIDDVMTTGSTVHELAKVLLRAGADRVDIWVCARAGHL